VVEVSDVDTVQVYSQTEVDGVEDITTFDTIPLKLNVGELAILLEKVAVMVTTDELETFIDETLDERATEGSDLV